MSNDQTIYDVVVIGSGVCGAVTAWKLAESGARVLVLEAGESAPGEGGPDRLQLVGSFARAAQKNPGAPYRGRDGDRFAPGPETRRDYYRQPPGQDLCMANCQFREHFVDFASLLAS
ncbi:MAG: FAD-dependent oxidoreductase [Acidobacteria bacterium]|nr:FAD-dependent oxidoreductase [Acidobacteriota bacterium]